MKPKPRVVFDTNIVISAILFGGNPRQCLELVRHGHIQLITSKTLLLELSDKLMHKFAWDKSQVVTLLEGIRDFAVVVEPSKKIKRITSDPTDNRVLECAKEGEADYIISGDKQHILPLVKFGNSQILSASDFLSRVLSFKN